MREKITDAEFEVIHDPRPEPPPERETWTDGFAEEYQASNIWGRLAFWVVFLGGMAAVTVLARWVVY